MILALAEPVVTAELAATEAVEAAEEAEKTEADKGLLEATTSLLTATVWLAGTGLTALLSLVQ
jgi:hypothetical protein